MKITIRQETREDHKEVFSLIEKAFEKEPYSDHGEQFLVERLRKSNAFIPQLSLVAEAKGVVVGYILVTALKIKGEREEFDSLALAPVAVLPELHGKGIGAQLIEEAHRKAIELGYTSVILLGHAAYYPRFGYRQAHTFGITLPFEVPKENCMAIELVADALKGVQGVVAYPQEFYE